MTEPTPYSWRILAALQRLPHLYGGTVSRGERLRRRARNRVARASRARNRG